MNKETAELISRLNAGRDILKRLTRLVSCSEFGAMISAAPPPSEERVREALKAIAEGSWNRRRPNGKPMNVRDFARQALHDTTPNLNHRGGA